MKDIDGKLQDIIFHNIVAIEADETTTFFNG